MSIQHTEIRHAARLKNRHVACHFSDGVKHLKRFIPNIRRNTA